MELFRFTKEAHLAAAGKLPGTELTDDGVSRKRERIQVLENKFLEKYFGTAHPATPGLWIPVIAAGLYLGITGPQGLQLTLALYVVGVLSITLVEYVVHRWLFHQVSDNHDDQMTHFILHGYHHDFPRDRLRLVLPLAFILPLAAFFAGLCWLVAREHWLQLFVGLATGYMAYDWIHYYTHHARPKNRVGKWLMKYHLLHHHDSPNHRYGISTPLWDLVFGTYLGNEARVRQMHADRARQPLEKDAAQTETGPIDEEDDATES